MLGIYLLHPRNLTLKLGKMPQRIRFQCRA